MKSKLPKDTLFFFFLNCGLNLTPTNQSTLVDIHIDKMRSTRIQKKNEATLLTGMIFFFLKIL